MFVDHALQSWVAGWVGAAHQVMMTFVASACLKLLSSITDTLRELSFFVSFRGMLAPDGALSSCVLDRLLTAYAFAVCMEYNDYTKQLVRYQPLIPSDELCKHQRYLDAIGALVLE